MALSSTLLRWYDRDRRDLPWRRAPSPYRTLVSEFMLQQTVVATVVPYFERFVARFPDVATLAMASQDEVLAHWSGLGYYSRARNLHRAACAIVEDHGGEVPQDETGLRDLPGVGEYTAAAVAAIAFGVRTFALDGNAARVMARLRGERRAIDDPRVRTELRSAGQALVPAARAGDFAQALMELGARVCVPRNPRCTECPVARLCTARATGAATVLPLRRPRMAKRAVELVCVAIERRGRVLLVRRPENGLLAGTWALPLSESRGREAHGPAVRRALGGLGLTTAGRLSLAGQVRHLFTHRDVSARVFRAKARGRLSAFADGKWVRANQLPSMPLSSFSRKLLGLLPQYRKGESP